MVVTLHHPPIFSSLEAHNRGAESNQHTPRARGPMGAVNHSSGLTLRVLGCAHVPWKVRNILEMETKGRIWHHERGEGW